GGGGKSWSLPGGGGGGVHRGWFLLRLAFGVGKTIFLPFPVTRLGHVWSAPFEYFTRRYQIVRSRR
ncbi:respiratory nitrate reductase subunit gamma, partial [Escherichia coli]|nr:respiratory nitrate reductase subunit gamma [Escherichia coli]